MVDPRARALWEAMALDATVTIARMLASEADLEATLDLVAKRGKALVSARAIVIQLEEDGELVVAAAAGEVPGGLVGGRADADLGLAEETVLAIPLTLRGRSHGALVAVGSEFSIEDEEVLETFAASAAAAVASARSSDLTCRRDQLAASEAMRARWADELRAGALAGLGNLRLTLAAIEGADPLAAQGLTQQAIEDVEVEIEKLRSLIAELRPRALDELGLGAAIEALADRVESPEMEIQTRIELASEAGQVETGCSEELETAVYRIVQEALGNAVRHAGATYVAVEVVDSDGGMRVTVRDDGKGFDPRANSGFGLSGMRERAELFGGSLEIDSSAGRGTEVRATIPIPTSPRPAGPTR